MRKVLPLTTAMLVLVALASTGLAQSSSYKRTVDQRHADFTLPHIDSRKPVSLSDFRGKKVLLIHFASW